jgi:AcrR family transcriptional regulator
MQELSKDEIIKTSIVKAAETVFQKWGLIKTTMEDIAREAGKGKSTLYYYYKSKEEIFDAVIHKEIDSVMSKAKKAMEGFDSTIEKIRVYVYTTFSEIRQYANLAEVMRSEFKGNHEYFNKLTMQYDKEEIGIITSILKSGIKSKEFRYMDDNELLETAEAITIMIRSLEYYLFLDNEDISRADLVINLLCKGL